MSGVAPLLVTASTATSAFPKTLDPSSFLSDWSGDGDTTLPYFTRHDAANSDVTTTTEKQQTSSWTGPVFKEDNGGSGYNIGSNNGSSFSTQPNNEFSDVHGTSGRRETNSNNTTVSRHDDKSGSTTGIGRPTSVAPKKPNHANTDWLRNPCKVFVGGVGQGTVESTIRAHFSQYGKIVDCIIVTHRKSGKSRGFGFITYDSEEAAQRAVGAKHKIDDVLVECRQALPKDEARVVAPHDSLYMPTKIFVGGIPDTVEEDDFKSFFSQFGDVLDVSLAYDKSSHRPRGFGFIVFSTLDAARAAVGRHSFFGKLVEAKHAVPRKPVPRGTRHQRRSPNVVAGTTTTTPTSAAASGGNRTRPGTSPLQVAEDATATWQQQTHGRSDAFNGVSSSLEATPDPTRYSPYSLLQNQSSATTIAGPFTSQHLLQQREQGPCFVPEQLSAPAPAGWPIFYSSTGDLHQGQDPQVSYEEGGPGLRNDLRGISAFSPQQQQQQMFPHYLYARTYTSRKPTGSFQFPSDRQPNAGSALKVLQGETARRIDWPPAEREFNFAQQSQQQQQQQQHFAYTQPNSPLVLGQSVPLVQISPNIAACSPSLRTLVSNLLSPPQPADASPPLISGATLEPLLPPTAATGKPDLTTGRNGAITGEGMSPNDAGITVAQQPGCVPVWSPKITSFQHGSGAPGTFDPSVVGSSPILTLFHPSQLQQSQMNFGSSPQGGPTHHFAGSPVKSPNVAQAQPQSVQHTGLFMPCYPTQLNERAVVSETGSSEDLQQRRSGAAMNSGGDPPTVSGSTSALSTQTVPGRYVTTVTNISHFNPATGLESQDASWSDAMNKLQGFPVAPAHGLQGLGSPIVHSAGGNIDPMTMTTAMALPWGSTQTLGLGSNLPGAVFFKGSPGPYNLQQAPVPGGTALFSPRLPCDVPQFGVAMNIQNSTGTPAAGEVQTVSAPLSPGGRHIARVSNTPPSSTPQTSERADSDQRGAIAATTTTIPGGTTDNYGYSLRRNTNPNEEIS